MCVCNYQEGPHVRKSKGVEREIIRLDELYPIYTVLKLKTEFVTTNVRKNEKEIWIELTRENLIATLIHIVG